MRAHRRSSWLFATLAVAVSLLLAPSTAAAEVTEGKATDPVGDSSGAPSQDIVGARVQYESTGQLTVSATMNGPIASGPKTFFRFTVATFSPPASCGGATVSLFGSSTGKGGQMTITGAQQPGTALMFVFGNTMSFTSFDQSAQLQNRPLSCMTLSVSNSEKSAVLDQLDAPLVFNRLTPSGPPPPAPRAPSVSAFARTVKVKQSKGAGTVTARCGLPGTERCSFSLTLYATVKHGHAAARVKVGTVTGQISGGKTGKLSLKLNAAGRRYLRRGSFHVEAKGAVTSTAGLVTSLHRRLTLKPTR